MTTVGKRIKKLRLANHLSQEELGIKLGVGRAAIHKYETGTVDNIPIKKVELMACVLHTSPSYILGWKDSKYLSNDLLDVAVNYVELNESGKRKAQEYVSDLLLLYKK